MLVSAGGTKVRGRIKGVEAFMTMTARTAVPIKVKPNVLWDFSLLFSQVLGSPAGAGGTVCPPYLALATLP